MGCHKRRQSPPVRSGGPLPQTPPPPASKHALFRGGRIRARPPRSPPAAPRKPLPPELQASSQGQDSSGRHRSHPRGGLSRRPFCRNFSASGKQGSRTFGYPETPPRRQMSDSAESARLALARTSFRVASKESTKI